LMFLAIVVGGSLTLYAARARAVGGGASFGPISRESFLLANNILLVVAMASVLLGTLYPLIIDALNAGKISVGPPYFNAVFYPLTAPLVFLMALGPIAAWRNASLPDLWTRLKWALGVAVVTALLLPIALGRWSPLVAFGMFLALWVFVATVVTLVQRLRSAHHGTLMAKLRANSASWYGMLIAHVGIAVFIVGVTLVKGYEVERDLKMDVGQSVDVAGDTFTFRGTTPADGPNYSAEIGAFELSRNGKLLRTLKPEKRTYLVSGQPGTWAAIDTGLFGDRYISLGEPVTDAGAKGAWSVRIYVKPFVDWIWAGCFLMALGGFIAVADRRYRLAPKRKSAPAPVAVPSAAD